jgi:hypothetical protein
MNNFSDKVSFIWSVADLLRGPYRPNQYKDVMLPLTVLRRLDCVLEPTKDKVLARLKSLQGGKIKDLEPLLCRVSGVRFYNTSRFTFEKLKGDPNNIAANLTNYIKGFSTQARGIIEHFGFEEHIGKLDKADRLYLIVLKFAEIDLHPDKVSNIEMGYIFEELIRRFNEASNEEAGDHFTPREVIRLMVNLLFVPDSEVLTTKGIVKTRISSFTIPASTPISGSSPTARRGAAGARFSWWTAPAFSRRCRRAWATSGTRSARLRARRLPVSSGRLRTTSTSASSITRTSPIGGSRWNGKIFTSVITV